MRIAFIHPFLYRYPRGIERYTLNLANALSAADAEVHLVTWRWPQPIHIDTLDPAVKVHVMPTSRYYAANAVVPFYTWDLLKYQYDFVWIFFAGYGEAEALSLVRRQAFGIVLHYPYTQVPHRYQEFLRFNLVRRAKHLVSVSQFVAEDAYGPFGRNSAVIHHGVDSEVFAPNAANRAMVRQMLGVSPNAPVLITAAALEKRKGVQRVIRALPQLVGEFPDLLYVVLGEGPSSASLKQLTSDLGLHEHVRFLGPQEHVAPYYQAADISLMLSHGEASSLTALESLACGLPVIVANRRPFDELIRPEYGLCIADEEPGAVARAIASLLRNPERRASMGKCGRARIVADFTWAKAGKSYMHLMASPAKLGTF